jgi:hypothetical protein
MGEMFVVIDSYDFIWEGTTDDYKKGSEPRNGPARDRVWRSFCSAEKRK